MDELAGRLEQSFDRYIKAMRSAIAKKNFEAAAQSVSRFCEAVKPLVPVLESLNTLP